MTRRLFIVVYMSARDSHKKNLLLEVRHIHLGTGLVLTLSPHTPNASLHDTHVHTVNRKGSSCRPVLSVHTT